MLKIGIDASYNKTCVCVVRDNTTLFYLIINEKKVPKTHIAKISQIKEVVVLNQNLQPDNKTHNKITLTIYPRVLHAHKISDLILTVINDEYRKLYHSNNNKNSVKIIIESPAFNAFRGNTTAQHTGLIFIIMGNLLKSGFTSISLITPTAVKKLAKDIIIKNGIKSTVNFKQKDYVITAMFYDLYHNEIDAEKFMGKKNNKFIDILSDIADSYFISKSD